MIIAVTHGARAQLQSSCECARAQVCADIYFITGGYWYYTALVAQDQTSSIHQIESAVDTESKEGVPGGGLQRKMEF